MPLKIIANTVWESAARLVITDTSDSELSDTLGLEHITSAQRWQKWTSSLTSDYRIAYVNAAAGLAADTAVLARADLHTGHRIKIRSYATYAGTSTTEYDSGDNFNPTLLGRNSQDYLWDLGGLTNKQGFGFEFAAGSGGNYTKKVHSLYIGNAFTLSYPQSVQVTPLPFPAHYIYQREAYICDFSWSFTIVPVTREETDTFQSLFRSLTAPVFIYDEDATLIDFSLLHGIMLPPVVTAAFDDLNQIQFTIYELRQWA